MPNNASGAATWARSHRRSDPPCNRNSASRFHPFANNRYATSVLPVDKGLAIAATDLNEHHRATLPSGNEVDHLYRGVGDAPPTVARQQGAV
jgi:hypothetical protein